MISLAYLWNELRRRAGRTVVTAVGLAAGVGMVMGIIGVSDGLSQAQNSVLSPLSSVGTDLIVTRTVAPTTSTASSTSAPGTFTPGSSTPGGRGGQRGGGFFAGGAGGALNASDTSALLQANSSVLTDLAKLGPAGTHFVHDFFVPGTLITFPDQAVSVVAKIPNVTSAVGALSLQAVHESGTVPKIVASVKTGGQTISARATPPPMTAAQRQQVFSCLQKSGVFDRRTGTGQQGSSGQQSRPGPGPGAGGGGRGGGFFGSDNPAFLKCLPAAQRSFIQKVVVPAQTIRQVLSPPTTDTQTSTYTVGGVDPTHPDTGLVTSAQLTNGKWLDANSAHEVLVNTAYASTNKLHVGQKLSINNTSYTIQGLVAPTLTGNVADIYFDLPTVQSISTNSQRINEVLVAVRSASDVSAVTAAIHQALPGAQVLTAKELADQVTGSLSNAHRLANDFGGALAIVVLLAAFAIAALLTLSSVAKRVREIGALRAIGWSRGRVVRQIMAETMGIGVLGGLLGVGLGALICAIVGAVGPGLSVTSTGLAVGASNVSSLINQSVTGSLTSVVHLKAPISASAVGWGFGGALLGGLLAGLAGGWRAARLAPATALRDLG